MYKYIHTYLFTCWFLLYQNFPTSNLIEERSIFHINKVETFFECNILTYTNYICRCWAADRNFFCRPDLHYAESIKGCVLAADLILQITQTSPIQKYGENCEVYGLFVQPGRRGGAQFFALILRKKAQYLGFSHTAYPPGPSSIALSKPRLTRFCCQQSLIW